MGLCKCPKKKVTNLFCFEHRVNVCEHCLVANHSKCIVKSYLQWLQDSDYNPVCAVCQRGLSDTECGDCVRLTCYDVFHWACINQFCQQLPSNTAPAGYTCPTCKAGIFPAQNLVSPVADELKKMLSQVNWARAGLGMPLIDEPAEQSKAPVPVQIAAKESRIPQTESTPVKENHISSLSNAAPLGVSPNHVASPSMVSSPNYTRPSAHVSPTQHSVINVDEGTSARGLDKSYDPRKLFDTTKEDTNNLLNLSHDHDENKYKRRSALEWLTKWLKSREGKHKRKDPQAVRKKFLMVLLIGVIGFITIIIIFSKLGRDAADDDPFLDPHANPNIRVNEQLGKQPID